MMSILFDKHLLACRNIIAEVFTLRSSIIVGLTWAVALRFGFSLLMFDLKRLIGLFSGRLRGVGQHGFVTALLTLEHRIHFT